MSTQDPSAEDLNKLLITTIRTFVVDELLKRGNRKIEMINRLDDGTLIIDITDRKKQKKVIVVYQNGQITTTPKARRRINEGTRYIPSYVEITANTHRYIYGNEEYKRSIDQGFGRSVLKILTQHLLREFTNDTGYPIKPYERIYAKTGRIDATENTYVLDHTQSLEQIPTEYFRVLNVDMSDCFTKEDTPKILIADNANYDNYLAGREYIAHLLEKVYSGRPEEASVGDYVVVYYATNDEGSATRNRKVVRFVNPNTFNRWFRT